MRIARAIAAAALAALVLQACKVGPNFQPPHEPVPEHYPGAPGAPGAPAPGAPQLSSEQEPVSFWWREFQDPELDKLIELASSGNLNLKAAYLRIVAARIEVQAASAQGLPRLNASGSYTREQLGLAGILVKLYKALGGGWESAPAVASAGSRTGQF